MVGIILVSHGTLASGLMDAMQMITGPQDNVVAISLQEADSPEDLKVRLNETLPLVDDGKGVLIMVDLYGATPFNISLRLYMESECKIEIISGVNLPMLVETIVCREGKDLRALYECAEKAGKDGVSSIPDTLVRN